MYHFTIKRQFLLVPPTICEEEFQKIDKFMELLGKTDVWKYIKNVKIKN